MSDIDQTDQANIQGNGTTPPSATTVAGNSAQAPKVRKQRTKAAKTEGQAHDNPPTREPIQLHPTVEKAMEQVVHGDNVVRLPPIPDPGDDPPSAYTSSPNFAGMQGLKVKTSVILGAPKNYCRSLLSMAARAGNVSLIDIKRADEISKQLHLIVPGVANDSDLMHDVAGVYEALAIPCIDRHGIPHLWCVRQYSNDGRELPSYASALRAAECAEEYWAQLCWVTNGWEVTKHRHPEKIHGEWPKALKRYDDWLENAFAGRIIRVGDHAILEEARGNR
jgi:hypothetical protein